MSEMWYLYHVFKPFNNDFDHFVTQCVQFLTDETFYYVEIIFEEDIRFQAGNFDFR